MKRNGFTADTAPKTGGRRLRATGLVTTVDGEPISKIGFVERILPDLDVKLVGSERDVDKVRTDLTIARAAKKYVQVLLSRSKTAKPQRDAHFELVDTVQECAQLLARRGSS